MPNLTQYVQVLTQVQNTVADSIKTDITSVAESVLKDVINRTITKQGLHCQISGDELVDYIYHDMAGYSFISRDHLFEREGFEEININAWNDVEIVVDGKRQKTDYSFLSPQQAIDVHQRMLRRTGTILNDAEPRAIADIGDGIRIAVEKTPVVDESVAVSSSIRKVNTQTLPRDVLIESGTLTSDMMDFLQIGLEHGVSMCLSGETGSGKTSLGGVLLSAASKTLRIFTIEEGSREWQLVRTDKESGKILNSVIHTKTRPNKDNPALSISQEDLVKDSLRFDPDIIAPGEIRGNEAFEVMSAANTGHTVITTTHSNGTLDTPGRLVTLAKKAFLMDDSTLFDMAVRAFPILIHIELGPDYRRRVTEIREVTRYHNGEIESALLWSFDVEDNIYDEEGKCTVKGKFRQLKGISQNLQRRLLKKGVSRAEMAPFLLE